MFKLHRDFRRPPIRPRTEIRGGCRRVHVEQAATYGFDERGLACAVWASQNVDPVFGQDDMDRIAEAAYPFNFHSCENHGRTSRHKCRSSARAAAAVAFCAARPRRSAPVLRK